LGADERSEKGAKIVKRGRRVKHRNPVSTQDSYTRLVAVSRSLGASAKTRELGELAGIKGTDKGLMGALAMLEVQGVIHMHSGRANQRCWEPGAQSEAPSQKRLAELRPYRALPGFLRKFSASALDAAVIRPALDMNEHDHDRLLGALKALVGLGLVSSELHGEQAVWWRWCGADGSRQLYDDDWDPRVSYEEGITEKELARRDLVLPRQRILTPEYDG
jgi:hypothetical protein